MAPHLSSARWRVKATFDRLFSRRLVPLPALAIALTGLLIPHFLSAQEPPAKGNPATGQSLPSDESIIKRLPEFSTEYVSDLLGIYARLENKAMVTALTAELRRRDPDGSLPLSDAEIANAAMDIGGGPASLYEVLENRILVLIIGLKYSEAIALMEKERAGQFAGKSFPFDIDLADTYATVGNMAAAREAYGRAAAAKESTAEQRALAEAGLATVEKLEAVNAAYELIRVKKYEDALARSEELKKKYPTDLEVQLLYAQALVPNYHYLEALPMLEAIKAKHYIGQPYPAQDALAESLRAVGRFDDARLAFDELSKDATVPIHVREEALINLREVSQMRTPTFRGDAEFLKEGEGNALLGRVDLSAPVAPDLTAGVRAWGFDVELTKDRSIRESSGDFLGAVAFVRKYLDDRLSYVEGRLGGGDHGDLTWGASIGKESPYIGVLGYDLSIDGNIPAIDSLQLIALNGVETRVEGSLTLPLPMRFEASAGAWGRQVDAQGVTLGDGWGAYFEIGRPIWENVLETKQLFLAFRSDYERFDANRLSNSEARRLDYNGDPADGRYLGTDLLEPRYSPNGLYLTYEAQMSSQLFGFFGGALYHDFSDEHWDFNFTAGLDYALTDTISIILEGGYYSDGTAASNADSEVIVGTVGWRAHF